MSAPPDAGAGASAGPGTPADPAASAGPDAPAAERAARLEALLGDPLDPANPHGQHALLRADDRRQRPAPTERLLLDGEVPPAAELVPREDGGRLRGLDDLARVLRPVFRRDVALGYGVGVAPLAAASAVWTAGDPAQRRATARLLLDGGRIAAAHPEPAQTNAFLRGEYRAAPAPGGGYVLHGCKDAVLDADRAELFVAYARIAAGTHPHSHSALLLDTRRLPPGGLRRTPRVHTAGMRGAGFAGLELTGCAVPRGALVGGPGEGAALAERTAQISRCLIPATVIAGVDGALRHAVRVATAEGRGIAAGGRRHRALAGVFADLLAGDCLAVTGLRALALLPGDARLLAAAVMYAVSDLLREDLDDLAGVLGADGHRPGPTGGGFQKLVRDVAPACRGAPGAVGSLATLVPHLGTLARTSWFRRPEPPAILFLPAVVTPPFEHRRLCAAGADGADDVLGATLAAAAQRRTAPGCGHAAGALDRLTRLFAGELRTLAERCAKLPDPEPGPGAGAGLRAVGPRPFALADRYARLLGAAALIGVRRGHEDSDSFLGDPAWAVLALTRIGRRLGLDVPPPPDGVTRAVVAELLRRHRDGRGFDLYATRLAG